MGHSIRFLRFALCSLRFAHRALLIANSGVGIGFATPPGPPALEVFVQGPVADDAVAVLFPEIFY